MSKAKSLQKSKKITIRDLKKAMGGSKSVQCAGQFVEAVTASGIASGKTREQ